MGRNTLNTAAVTTSMKIAERMAGGLNTFLPVWPSATRLIIPAVMMPMPPVAKACSEIHGDRACHVVMALRPKPSTINA